MFNTAKIESNRNFKDTSTKKNYKKIRAKHANKSDNIDDCNNFITFSITKLWISKSTIDLFSQPTSKKEHSARHLSLHVPMLTDSRLV